MLKRQSVPAMARQDAPGWGRKAPRARNPVVPPDECRALAEDGIIMRKMQYRGRIAGVMKSVAGEYLPNNVLVTIHIAISVRRMLEIYGPASTYQRRK